MTRYVALLRGINVGGKKKVPMAELRELVVGLGYDHVSTYINSGNLLLNADQKPAEVGTRIAGAIAERFGFTVHVVVRTEAQLRKVLAANPYPEGKPAQVTVAFLAGEPTAGAEQRFATLKADNERYEFAGLDVYVDFAGGLADSKLAAQMSKAVGTSATVRNIRTVAKLVELMDR